MPRVPREFTEKTKFCSVCGKSIPYYVRICDRCGSIQRPVGGDGQPLPPDQTKPCDHCGKPVPKSDKLCPECEEESRPQFAGLSSRGKGARVAAATFGVFGVAGVGAGIWALLVVNGITLGAVLLGVSALVVVISTGAYIAIRSSSAKRAAAEADESEDSDGDESPPAEVAGSAPGGPSDIGD